MSNRKFPSIFIDTSAWVALNEKQNGYHKRAKNFIQKVKEGKYNFRPVHTSEFILQETYSYLNYNYNFNAAVDIINRIRNSNVIIHPFSSVQFDNIWKKIKETKNGFSFVDWTTIVYMDRYDIQHIFSFGSDFSKFGLKRYP